MVSPPAAKVSAPAANGDGSFQAARSASILGPGPIAADFNGDDFPDFVCGGSGGVLKYGNGTACSRDGLSLGKGDGTFTSGGPGFGAGLNPIPGADQFPNIPTVGDFDHNGSLDVVITTGTGVMVGLNTGGNPPKLALLTLSATSIVGG
jgi:hypothetical protein